MGQGGGIIAHSNLGGNFPGHNHTSPSFKSLAMLLLINPSVTLLGLSFVGSRQCNSLDQVIFIRPIQTLAFASKCAKGPDDFGTASHLLFWCSFCFIDVNPNTIPMIRKPLPSALVFQYILDKLRAWGIIYCHHSVQNMFFPIPCQFSSLFVNIEEQLFVTQYFW